MDPTKKTSRQTPGGGEPAPGTNAPTVDLAAESGATRQVDPRLPHERDEVATPTQSERPRDKIKQAHQDIAAGRTDTDNRNKTEEIIEKKSGERLRKKP
jgi:hypothetical protein